jgi:hypothetical protein
MMSIFLYKKKKLPANFFSFFLQKKNLAIFFDYFIQQYIVLRTKLYKQKNAPLSKMKTECFFVIFYL